MEKLRELMKEHQDKAAANSLGHNGGKACANNAPVEDHNKRVVQHYFKNAADKTCAHGVFDMTTVAKKRQAARDHNLEWCCERKSAQV